MEPVKLGVIGCGVIGSVTLKDAMASELVKVVAVADLRVSRREWASQQGVPRVYEDGRDLLDQDPEVEAVLVAFPAGTRTAMGLHALARGKHLLTEKPVANNAREVQTLMDRRGDRVVACLSSRFRFFESAVKAREVVNSGVLGDLRRLHVRALLAAGPKNNSVPPPWRESFCLNAGGILTNWSCYDLDYILGTAGWSFQPKTVLAQTWPCAPAFRCHVAPESDAEAWYSAFVLGEDGMVLTLERGEFLPQRSEMAWLISGSEGALHLGMLNTDDRKLVLNVGTTEKGVTETVIWEGKDTQPGGNRLGIEDFALAIREHRPPATGMEQALTMMQITDAIYQSARTGRAVEI